MNWVKAASAARAGAWNVSARNRPRIGARQTFNNALMRPSDRAAVRSRRGCGTDAQGRCYSARSCFNTITAPVACEPKRASKLERTEGGLPRQLLVLHPMRDDAVLAEPPHLVLFIILEIALEPFDIAFAAGKRADLLLLVGALEVERRAIAAGIYFLLAEQDELVVAGNFLPHRL